MKYNNVLHGVFLERKNRFVARVSIRGREEIVHVKNTGRCKELLIPGAKVILTEGQGQTRKTKYDLIAVYKILSDGSEILINMDSQIPNAVAAEWLKVCGLFSDQAVIRREVTFSSSRFDLYVEDGERKVFVEVKGVTLEREGKASFPDAPTTRGERHVRELILAKEMGYEAIILFIIQMKGIALFTPNFETDPAFSATLCRAEKEGVKIMALDSLVTEDSIVADSLIPIRL